MCLLVFAWRVVPRFPLVFAGNRDEFHARLAAPMDWWRRPEGLLAGRDLSGGGTWLGMTRHGRFGVVTNFRELGGSKPGAPSRGALITQLADPAISLDAFATSLDDHGDRYAGYNLVFGEPAAGTLFVHSNRDGSARPVEPGIHGLSNHLLDTPWPKLTRTLARFEQALGDEQPAVDALFDALADRTRAPDDELPDTGIGRDWERRLSAPFIVGDEYGTRCSTVVMLRDDGESCVIERRFDPGGEVAGESRFEFDTMPFRPRSLAT